MGLSRDEEREAFQKIYGCIAVVGLIARRAVAFGREVNDYENNYPCLSKSCG